MGIEKASVGNVDVGDDLAYVEQGSVALDDSTTNDDRYRIPVYLQDGFKLIWEWGGLSLSDGSADTDVLLRLIEPDGTIASGINADPHPNIVEPTDVTYTATGDEKLYFRVQNIGTTSYTAASAAADAVEFWTEWRVER